MKLNMLLILVLLLITPVAAQEKDMQHEMNSNIQELSDFHDIIYPIWHTAYPENDYEALRGYKDEVSARAEKLFTVRKLPGILREKQEKWDKGLEQFRKAVEAYNTAADGKDDQGLLDAAEDLHSKFEMLVRIIRPVLKEVDEFHQILYVVYHKDLPARDFKAISEKSSEFVSRAEAITKAKLSKRLESRAEKFNAASQELLYAAEELNKICNGQNNEAISSAVEVVHDKYQLLEGVFE